MIIKCFLYFIALSDFHLFRLLRLGVNIPHHLSSCNIFFFFTYKFFSLLRKDVLAVNENHQKHPYCYGNAVGLPEGEWATFCSCPLKGFLGQRGDTGLKVFCIFLVWLFQMWEVDLKSEWAWESPGKLVRTESWAPPPEFLSYFFLELWTLSLILLLYQSLLKVK